MFSQSVRQAMHSEQLVTVTRGTLVSDVARLMAEHGVSAVIVADCKTVEGIFTECDAVCRVLAIDRDPHVTRVEEVMTALPLAVDSERAFGHALKVMHEHGFRHLPVVEGGRLVGIVTARDALDPDMEDFVCEANRRQSLS